MDLTSVHSYQAEILQHNNPFPIEITAAAASAAVADHAWAYSIVDSSRVSTFFISILLIVYGSFRSLALEEDKDGKKHFVLFICERLCDVHVAGGIHATSLKEICTRSKVIY